MPAHLILEEKHALPLYETEITAAEHKQLEARVRKATPRDRARFMLPWLVTHADQDQRKALFRSFPPLRPFYWLNLRCYRRFDQALARAA